MLPPAFEGMYHTIVEEFEEFVDEFDIKGFEPFPEFNSAWTPEEHSKVIYERVGFIMVGAVRAFAETDPDKLARAESRVSQLAQKERTRNTYFEGSN